MKTLSNTTLWRRKNAERSKRQRADYYTRNRDKIIAKSQVYQNAHKEIISTRQKQYRINNLDKMRAREHNGYLKHIYGITQEQWLKLYDLQAATCPICLHKLYKFNNKEGKRAADVDHDHKKPNRVRGLLCWRCNKFKVGNLTIDEAKRIVTYLESDFDGRLL